VKRHLSISVTRNIFVPGWILLVGFALLNAQPLGAMVSLSMFVVGVLVIPGVVMLRRVVEVDTRALVIPKGPIARMWRRVSKQRR